MTDDNIDAIDPSHGSPSPDSTGSQWFPSTGGFADPGICHETPDGLVPEVQFMSYDTPDGKPPESACWGYGSRFFDPRTFGTPGLKSYSSSVWYEGETVNTALRPQAQCMADADGYLQLTIDGSRGPIDSYEAELWPNEFVDVTWIAYGAISVTIDGHSRDAQGARRFTFDELFGGRPEARREIELEAIFLNRKPISAVVVINRFLETDNVTEEFKVMKWELAVKPNVPVLGGFFLLSKAALSAEISIKLKKENGAGLAGSVKFSKKEVEQVLNYTLWENGEFLILKNQKAEIEVGQGRETSGGGQKFSAKILFSVKSNSVQIYSGEYGTIDAGVEYELEGALFTFEKDSKGAWIKIEPPKFTISNAMPAIKGVLKYKGIDFEVSGEIKGKLELTLNWLVILAAMASSAIPIAIVIAGITTIAVNGTQFVKARGVAEARNLAYQKADALARGYMDGIWGFGQNQKQSGKAKSAEEMEYYELGHWKGLIYREDLIKKQFGPKGILISEWLADHGEEATNQARAEFLERMLIVAWREYGKEHSGTVTSILLNQRQDWLTLFSGKSPQSMGEYQVILWKEVRVMDPSNQKLSDGFF